MSPAPLCSMRPGVRLVLSISALVTALTGCSRTESQASSGGASASASPSPSPVASNGSRPGSSGAPRRGHMDCAHFLTGTVEASKSLKISMWAEPGSWGGLSSDLQRLPPGAELCGATHLGEPKDKDKPGFISVFFRSSLYGDDLRKFWTPVLTAAGCTFREDNSFHDQTKFVWICPHEKGGVVTVITNPGDEIYSIGFMKH